MAGNLIYRQCRGCKGTGIQRVIVGGTGDSPVWDDVTCRQCDGELKLFWGEDNFSDGLYYTYQISEATDASEWAALSDGNKAAYAMILSMGVVDLTDGTSIRTTLWAMFDSESTTRANLITLLGE